MDAKALLMSQGWSGPGTPLNPGRRPGTHGGLGLTKPLLVARKQNTLGVGKKTGFDATNQWWLRSFEAALSGVGTPGTATPTSQDSYCPGITAGSDLHRHFVKGGILAGTLESKLIESTVSSAQEQKKRKRGESLSDDTEERARRKEEKRKRKHAEDASSAKKDRKDKKSKDDKKEKKEKKAKKEKKQRKEKEKEEKKLRKAAKKKEDKTIESDCADSNPDQSSRDTSPDSATVRVKQSRETSTSTEGSSSSEDTKRKDRKRKHKDKDGKKSDTDEKKATKTSEDKKKRKKEKQQKGDKRSKD